MWENIISALIGAVVAAVTTYILSSRRDVSSKRRELIVQHLVAAYEAFDASELKDPTKEKLDIERAVANLQLFGSEELVRLVKAFHDKLKVNGQAELDPLMKQIRLEVRKAVGLAPLTSDYAIMRFSELERHGGVE